MTGKIELTISNKRLNYHLILERKITIIKGKSATGKTSLINILERNIGQEFKSSLKIYNPRNVEIRVFNRAVNWERDLQELENSVIFMDETIDYLYTKAFQNAMASSDCYFVIISRSGQFVHVPYAISSIYEFRTSSTDEKTHITEMYKLYCIKESELNADIVITEDSNAGYEFYKELLKNDVIAASGNSNLLPLMRKQKTDNVIAIVDGAAFGGYIEAVLQLIKRMNNTNILAPESFEWLLLNSGMFNRYVKDELSNTADYCDSREYLTWERYFTHLLNELSEKYYGFNYSKKKLNEKYLNDRNREDVTKLLIKSAVMKNM